MRSYAPVPPSPSEGTGGERGGRGSARRWLVPACVLALLAVTVSALWVTGGFKETPKQPTVKTGQTLDLGLFTVKIRDARIGSAEAGPGGPPERFLIVRMRVINRGRETKPLGQGGLADGVVALTKNGKWVKPEQAEGTAGGAETDVAQPDLPVEAAVMWKLHPSEAPTKLTVGLREWKYEQGFTDSSFNWNVQMEKDVLAGRLTLPVAPETPAAPNSATPNSAAPNGTAPTPTARPTAPAARPGTPRPPDTPRSTASRP